MWQNLLRHCAVLTKVSEEFAPHYLAEIRHDMRQTTLGGSACGVVRRVMGTTRSYACATQAGLTWLGSNVMRTSRVVLPLCARRATRISFLPWYWVLKGLLAL
jgi:hypothetical protein